MNIKEMEERSGLIRANIRYYEKEGLLSPARRENGYRDYSEKDLELLKRIQLMRELGISLEEIRQLKEYPEQLKQIMEQRLTAMEREILDRNDAVTVCSEICFEGVSFYSMDTEHYLGRLEELYQERYQKDTELPSMVKELDKEPVEPQPWKRYLARSFDLMLYKLLIILVWCVLLGYFYNSQNFLAPTILNLVSIIVMIFLEPVFLTCWGTTPGKWIFGISIRDRDGQKLSYQKALIRVWRVVWKGLGLSIPFYELYRTNRCYNECMKGETMEWDRYLDTEYQIRKKKLWKIAIAAGISWSIVFGAVFGMMWNQRIPQQPCSSDYLPADGFVANYNWYVDQLGETNFYYTGENCYLESDGTYRGDPDSQNTPHLQWKEEDEILTEVYFEEKNYTNLGYPNYKQQAACAILAFYGDQLLTNSVYTEDLLESNFLVFKGGQEELTLWNLKMGYLMGLLDWKNAGRSCEFTADGIHVKYQVIVDDTEITPEMDPVDIESAQDDQWHDIEIRFSVKKVE